MLSLRTRTSSIHTSQFKSAIHSHCSWHYSLCSTTMQPHYSASFLQSRAFSTFDYKTKHPKRYNKQNNTNPFATDSNNVHNQDNTNEQTDSNDSQVDITKSRYYPSSSAKPPTIHADIDFNNLSADKQPTLLQIFLHFQSLQNELKSHDYHRAKNEMVTTLHSLYNISPVNLVQEYQRWDKTKKKPKNETEFDKYIQKHEEQAYQKQKQRQTKSTTEEKQEAKKKQQWLKSLPAQFQHLLTSLPSSSTHFITSLEPLLSFLSSHYTEYHNPLHYNTPTKAHLLSFCVSARSPQSSNTNQHYVTREQYGTKYNTTAVLELLESYRLQWKHFPKSPLQQQALQELTQNIRKLSYSLSLRSQKQQRYDDIRKQQLLDEQSATFLEYDSHEFNQQAVILYIHLLYQYIFQSTQQFHHSLSAINTYLPDLFFLDQWKSAALKQIKYNVLKQYEYVQCCEEALKYCKSILATAAISLPSTSYEADFNRCSAVV